MANAITGFFQTLVAAVEDASRLLAPTWHAADSIYWNYSPEEAGLYQTLNVPIPADPSAAVADQGAGDLVLNDIGFTTTSIVMDRHPSFAYTVRDFEQFNSPLQIRQVFLDAGLKAVKNNINAAVTSLLVQANLTTNSQITGSASAITTAQMTSAMATLLDQKVPVTDPNMMSLLLPPKVYSTLLDPTTGGAGAAWSQALIAGTSIAEKTHQQGYFPVPTFGCTMKVDQQMTVSGTKPSRTFTAAYFHKWGVAGVTRPLPKPDQNVVDYMYLPFGSNPAYDGAYGDGEKNPIMLRVMVSYNHYPKTGYIVSVDAGFGLKVIREYMIQLFSITE